MCMYAGENWMEFLFMFVSHCLYCNKALLTADRVVNLYIYTKLCNHVFVAAFCLQETIIETASHGAVKNWDIVKVDEC